MAIGEEIKNNTIKNIASAGISRGKIYVCKVIESIILMLICTFLILIGTIIAGYLILGIGNNVEFISILQDCLIRGGIALLLWSGAIALAVLITILIKGATAASFTYVIIIMFVGQLFMTLGKYINPIFGHMYKYLLTTQLTQVSSATNLSTNDMLVAGVTGLFYTVVITIVGVSIMRKKDL